MKPKARKAFAEFFSIDEEEAEEFSSSYIGTGETISDIIPAAVGHALIKQGINPGFVSVSIKQMDLSHPNILKQMDIRLYQLSCPYNSKLIHFFDETGIQSLIGATKQTLQEFQCLNPCHPTKETSLNP